MKKETPQIITTKDGSHSLELPGMDETYHSRHGALTESEYVYIQMGLSLFGENQPVKILELGFGTGLNALLTLKEAENQQRMIEYHTVEAFPLERDVFSRLNYGAMVSSHEKFLLLHEAVWNEKTTISSTFEMHKYQQLIQEVELPDNYFDLVYYDAFAPSKQEEIWAAPVLEKIKRSMKEDSLLVTYCAQGAFKRNLKSIGFIVEELPGPPGKKEMVRAWVTR